MRFKEPFIVGLRESYHYEPRLEKKINLVGVELGFFMMKREDTETIIYQDELGNYNEISESEVMRVSKNKDLEKTLESKITQRYVRMIDYCKIQKEKALEEMDRFIDKKSIYLREMNDLTRKTSCNDDSTDNQKVAYNCLKKAVRRANKRLYSYEKKANKSNEVLEAVTMAKDTSIENMKKMIKSIKC